MKTTIAIEIDTDTLVNFNDQYLAKLWHIAQANPAPIDDEAAGRIAEAIGREIICRWLKATPADLYSHQGEHHYWSVLQKHGDWKNGKWTPGKAAECKHCGQDHMAPAPPNCLQCGSPLNSAA